MKGKILDFSITTNQGLISGDDDCRYHFKGSAWREQANPERNMGVDFDIDKVSGEAIDIFLINQQTRISTVYEQPVQNLDKLKPKWKFIFSFFDESGLPSERRPEYRSNYSKLTFWEKTKITVNILAIIFGPFYFLCLGMWQKALTFFAICFIIGIIEINFFPQFSGILNLIIPVLAGVTANPTYYLYKVKGSKSFNVFEGLF